MNDTKTGKQISDLDQMLAGVEDLAKVLGQYRNELINNGLPESLANDMISNISKLMWQKSLGLKE
jgi:hypothetical protein